MPEVRPGTFGGHSAGDGGRAAEHRGLWDGLSLHLSERKLLLLLGDIGCWIIAALISSSVGGGFPATLAVGLGIGTVAWLLSAWVTGGYDVDTAASTVRILPVIFKAGAATALVMFTWAFFSHGAVGRVEWMLSLLTGVELLTLWRVSYLTVFTMPLFSRRILFAGTDALNVELATMIRQVWPTQFAIVGFISADPHAGDQTGHILGDLSDAPAVAKALRASEIIAGPDAIADTAQLERLLTCTNQGVKVTPASILYEDLLKRVPVGQVDQRYIIDLARGAYSDRTYLGLKRLIDISLATLGSLIFVLLLPFIAMAIVLDSGRPIFYRQERVGQQSRVFRITKFRTMRQASEFQNEPRWAERGDSRITRVGRVLRSTRLDELPQVSSILRGHMSVVGPRPERPQFVAELAKQIPFYSTRHAVKPGLTGWAQIRMGYAATVEDSRAKLEYDLFYVRRPSLLFDALIIVRTIGTVLRLRGR
jgi:exopolysaccharide biosynthesis polyprenyl glycosylphosphotransferase